MIESALRSYFLLLEAGGHPTTTNLSDVWASSVASAPKWLLRNCEVGDALCNLRRDRLRAVCKYWKACLDEEDANRDACVFGLRGESRPSQRVALSNAYRAQTRREQIERSKAYRDGMGDLTKNLLPRLKDLKSGSTL